MHAQIPDCSAHTGSSCGISRSSMPMIREMQYAQIADDRPYLAMVNIGPILRLKL